MTKRIIYTNETGGVSIIIPAKNYDINAVAAKDVPAGAAFEIVDISAIPTERTFRDAWRKIGKTVEIDIPAAVGVAHTMRRATRDKLMSPLDIKAGIPSEARKAEARRAKIRAAFAKHQININKAATEKDLLCAVQGLRREAGNGPA